MFIYTTQNITISVGMNNALLSLTFLYRPLKTTQKLSTVINALDIH